MKTTLNKIIRIFLIGILTLTTACEDSVYKSNDNVNNTNFAVSESFSFEVPITDQSRIDMQTINGSITIITRQDSNIIKITGKRSVKSESTEDAQKHLAFLNVNIIEGIDNIFITTEQPKDSQGRTYLVDYIIEMPNNWNLQLDQINGNIEIDTVYGNIETELVNGNVILDNVTGCVQVNLVNGVINASVTLPSTGDCSLKNVNGRILLSIPDTTSALFRASVVNGSVGVHNLVLTNLHSSSKEIQGTLGTGAGNVSCTLVNGEIVVTGTDN